MLGKLIKYDFKWINKVMVIYYIILIVLAALTRLTSVFESTIGVITHAVLNSLFIACIFSVYINAIIRTWERYKITLYKDESYLTHTLPIKRSTIYNAKLLSGVFTILLATIIVFAGILIVYLTPNNLVKLQEFLDILVYANGRTLAYVLIILVAVVFLLELLTMLQLGIFGVTIGHRSNNNKNVKSVLLGIVFYFLTQLILFLAIYTIALFVPHVMDLFRSVGTAQVASIRLLIILSAVLYTIFNVCYYFTSKHLLNKGVNVD